MSWNPACPLSMHILAWYQSKQLPFDCHHHCDRYRVAIDARFRSMWPGAPWSWGLSGCRDHVSLRRLSNTREFLAASCTAETSLVQIICIQFQKRVKAELIGVLTWIQFKAERIQVRRNIACTVGVLVVIPSSTNIIGCFKDLCGNVKLFLELYGGTYTAESTSLDMVLALANVDASDWYIGLEKKCTLHQ